MRSAYCGKKVAEAAKRFSGVVGGEHDFETLEVKQFGVGGVSVH